MEHIVTLSDNGNCSCDSNDHERARLTERFYRVSAAASKAKGGTGLGLAIVKHIVNRHRGVLEIEAAPGRGARFSVWLPAAPPKSEAAAKPRAKT